MYAAQCDARMGKCEPRWRSQRLSMRPSSIRSMDPAGWCCGYSKQQQQRGRCVAPREMNVAAGPGSEGRPVAAEIQSMSLSARRYREPNGGSPVEKAFVRLCAVCVNGRWRRCACQVNTSVVLARQTSTIGGAFR